jgi:nicotinate-nucleotide adenylyltransferase
MKLEKIGIFGGTFDPPHIAHLIMADEAQKQLDLSCLLWVLTPTPPHKPDITITPLEHRFNMLQLAIADNPRFLLSRVDMDRPGPYYALDTVQILSSQYPNSEMIYLMGGDSLHDLSKWHSPIDFIQACYKLGVMRRPGDSIDMSELEVIFPGITCKVLFINAPQIGISSSDIRRRIAEGSPFRYFLPMAVYDFIQIHRSYQ